MRDIQKILSFTKKDVYHQKILLWQYPTTSQKTRKTNSDFSSFIRSGNVLPQQKVLLWIFILGEV